MNSEVRIDVAAVPDHVWESGCRILSQAVRRFMEDTENRQKYEAWLNTSEKIAASRKEDKE